jgi:hypothetical protein
MRERYSQPDILAFSGLGIIWGEGMPCVGQQGVDLIVIPLSARFGSNLVGDEKKIDKICCCAYFFAWH